jgi:hypothetical protein
MRSICPICSRVPGIVSACTVPRPEKLFSMRTFVWRPREHDINYLLAEQAEVGKWISRISPDKPMITSSQGLRVA